MKTIVKSGKYIPETLWECSLVACADCVHLKDLSVVGDGFPLVFQCDTRSKLTRQFRALDSSPPVR